MEEISSGMKRKMDSCDDCEADQTCRDTNYNPLHCSVCDVVCNSTAMMENHVNGKKHKKKMLGQSRRTTINTWEFWCDSCLIGCNSHATMETHLGGKMHLESCCKRRKRLLQVEIKKEEEEEDSTNKEACFSDKEEEELIKPQVELTEETCNYKEEELKKDKVCDDEKMQDEANNVITEHQEDEVMVRTAEKDEQEEEIKKDNICDHGKMQDKANQIIKDQEETEYIGIKHEERHATKIEAKDGLWCNICDLQCNSYLMMLAHRSGKKHTAMEAKAGLKVNKDRVDLQQGNKMREMKEERNKEFWCLICKVTYNTQAMITKHLKGPEHKAKLASRRR